MVAAGTGIPDGEHDVARQLALDVGVVLHDLSAPEVPWLVEKGAGKGGEGWGSGKNWKSAGDAGNSAAGAAGRDTTGWSGSWAAAELEDIALGEEGRVLPKPLSALAPGGVVINGEAAAEDGFVAAQELIGGADAWFEGSPIHVDARGAPYAVLIGDEELAGSGVGARGGGGRNEVG